MNIALADLEGINPHETEYLYDEIFTRRGYEPPGLQLPDAPVVFDVGANIGMYTLYVKSRRPDASVYAFEPVAPVFAVLRRNVERHSVSARLFPCGLGEREDEADFTYYPGYSTMSTRDTLADTPAEKAFVKKQVAADQPPEARQMLDELLDYRFREESWPCRLRRLSSVLEENPVSRIDVLKIDVQRGERQVLRGLDERHWPLVRQILMEVHDDPAGSTAGALDAVVAELEGRGFRVTAEQEERFAGSDRHTLFATSDPNP